MQVEAEGVGEEFAEAIAIGIGVGIGLSAAGEPGGKILSVFRAGCAVGESGGPVRADVVVGPGGGIDQHHGGAGAVGSSGPGGEWRVGEVLNGGVGGIIEFDGVAAVVEGTGESSCDG